MPHQRPHSHRFLPPPRPAVRHQRGEPHQPQGGDRSLDRARPRHPRPASMTQLRLPPMRASDYTIRALDESTWAPFAALVERNNGVFGGCWCMGFHPEGVGTKDTTPKLNRARKLERVRAGTTHAALVFA